MKKREDQNSAWHFVENNKKSILSKLYWKLQMVNHVARKRLWNPYYPDLTLASLSPVFIPLILPRSVCLLFHSLTRFGLLYRPSVGYWHHWKVDILNTGINHFLIIFLDFDKVIFDKVIFDKVIFDKVIFDKVIFDKVIFGKVIFDKVNSNPLEKLR
jgi:hypothetical protein